MMDEILNALHSISNEKIIPFVFDNILDELELTTSTEDVVIISADKERMD